MSHADPSDTGTPPPSTAALEGLPSDAWAALLPHVRAGLHDLDHASVTDQVARLRDAPTGRLAGGRLRRELCVVLSAGGPAWQAVRARLADETELPRAARRLLSTAEDERHDPDGSDDGAASGSDGTERQRERVRALREERDRWRRRAEGAEARASRLDRQVAELEGALEAARSELEGLRDELASAAEERRRAVDRERRRHEARLAELRDEVSSLRRADDERRSRAQRDQRRASRRSEIKTPRPASEAAAPRVAPGRPTRLPEGVEAGTAEAVALLLHPGRLVLVDGYNLTRQHRGDLDLEAQRTWLVQLLAALAARRRVRPVAVFDGTRASGQRPRSGAREVEVRFTPSGITADDELVLAVEATDEPVVVVTDDRELADRLRAGGADVVGTQPFLWVAR